MLKQAGLVISLVIISLVSASGQSGHNSSPVTVSPVALTRSALPPSQAGAALSNEEIKKQQAVLETSMGNIVIEFFPDKAPQHVRHFIELVKSNYYRGIIFHRIIRNVMIQAGDPTTKDPAKRSLYGSGGLGTMKAEITATAFVRGTVGAALYPNSPNSAGSQFFICVTDLAEFNRKYTAWGHVAEGMDVVEKISRIPVDELQIAKPRVEIRNTYLRPIPTLPFAGSTPEEMKNFHVLLETTKGKMEVEFFPEAAPEHVRNFLRLSKAGLYDNTAWTRIMAGFIIQGGDLTSRKTPITADQMNKYVKTLKMEPSDLKHELGTLSMARGEAPDSASTSFFISLGDQPSMDGKYTIFGRVISGKEVLEAISAVKVAENGIPQERVDLLRAEVLETGQ
jgi:peptidyl-prolyl cis-trans isomerase B (cyclophilin B)